MPEEVPFIDFQNMSVTYYNQWLDWAAYQASHTGDIMNDAVQLGLQQNDSWVIDGSHHDFSGNGTNDAWVMATAFLRAEGLDQSQVDDILGTAGNRDAQNRANLDTIFNRYADSIGHNNANDRMNAFPDTPNDYDWYVHDRDSSGDLGMQLAANFQGMQGGIMETLATGNLSPAISGVFIFVFDSALDISIGVFDFLSNVVGDIASGIGNFFQGVATFFDWFQQDDPNNCW